MLCNIEACCRHAELTDRTVVVDTNYAGAAYFKDDLRLYFESRQSRLILGLDAPLKASFDAMQVFPEFLQGRVNTYSVVWGPRAQWMPQRDEWGDGWLDSQSRQPITFDLLKPHKHQLLVHHAEGRSSLAHFALLRMVLSRTMSDELKRRLELTGRPYDAIHVRHTDYKSRYQPAVDELAKSPPAKLFVATDNIQVLREIRSTLGAERVFSFSALPEAAGEPIHKMYLPAEHRRAGNRDAILDLLMCASARRLIVVRLEEGGPAFSGYSRLAETLWASKIVLKHLVARDDLNFGLG